MKESSEYTILDFLIDLCYYYVVVHYASHKHHLKMGLKIHQLIMKLYIFCFFCPSWGEYVILDSRETIMAYVLPYYQIDLQKNHVVSENVG